MPRSLRGIKNLLLQSQCPPKIAALSISTGIFIAFSPFIGLHFLSVILIAKFSRLNPILLLAGILVHNPWTFFPIHLFGLAIGDLLLHGHLNSWEEMSALPWNHMGIEILWNLEFWADQKDVLWTVFKPFFLGSCVTASVTAAASYFLALSVAEKAGNYLSNHVVHHAAPEPSHSPED